MEFWHDYSIGHGRFVRYNPLLLAGRMPPPRHP